MSDRPFISHFSPQRTDPELLERIHVQEERRHLLEESVSAMRESVLTANKHHLLFIGPRGAGKTHLVRLIHHRLSQQADLTEKFRFAWLNEDETATSFLKLLILIYRDVSQRYPHDFPAADLQSIYGQPADIARERLGESLLRHLGGRTLVVLMENLDSLFKHMPEGEQRIWRAFVQNHPVFATVGTAQSLFDGVADRSQPFFGFFDTRHLTPLNVEDAVQLLTNIARVNGNKGDEELAAFLQTPTGHARVQAIHDLAGGNPRIYLIFSDFLAKENLDDLVRPFEETADRQLTSYYQERLRWLSAQQQEIIQFLCHHNQPVPVKNIAEGLFTTHNSITGQLKSLRDWNYLKAKQRGREVFYELAEPLMRLALQIKETHEYRPLKLIVDFLRIWYDRTDLENGLARHVPGSPGHSYFAEALSKENSSPVKLRHEILRRGLEFFDPVTCDDALLARIQCLAEETGNPQEWLALSAAQIVRMNWNQVILAASKVVLTPNSDPEIVSMALYNSGIAHKELNQLELALAAWLRAAEVPGTSVQQIGNAYNNLGNLKLEIGLLEDAAAHFREILKLVGASGGIIASGHIGLGLVYAREGKHEKAIASYTDALRVDALEPDLIAAALNNRAVEYRRLLRLDVALQDCDKLLSIEGLSADRRALGLMSKASVKLLQEDYLSVIEACTQVAGMVGLSNNQLARAFFLRGIAAQSQGSIEAALDDYERPFTLPENRVFSELGSNMPDFFDCLEMTTGRIVSLLMGLCFDAGVLKSRIERFVIHFARHQAVNLLGAELIKQLPFLAGSPLNAGGYDMWSASWSAACSVLKPEDQAKMEIPLRLLRTGITYLKTKDEGSLLVLPIEERKILRDALKLPPESAE